ncbi:type VII secretion-associated serine protease mycosin [Gordonia hydrophobica]|uniref:Type VII secretion-associated serine protease mycosin n=1 Tax=Gordonia hydrophobica TaxID=40516 RepID=A0ABZ2U1Z9_9ACTN|nr:type VII secretion-associated serine protease mycosin [Gordonia hydrophobica]MBM7366791.1 membrane-anchored mycosin MYCP [Gordonia hydrophobica]
MRTLITTATAIAVLWSACGIGVAAAAPPEPTEQRAKCAVATTATTTDAPAGHRLLGLEAAHRFSTGAGVKVAVIDTGVDPHPRLPRVIAGGDFVSDGDGLSDCDAHGTLVAGVIAGRPSAADDFVGVAPDATIISIRQSSGAFSAKRPDRGAAVVGAGYGPIETLAAAVDRAVELGAQVVNISEVACTAPGDTSGDRVLTAALTRARTKDVVVVVAAGNLTDTTACREQNPAGAASSATARAQVRTSVTPARLSPLVLAVGAVEPTGTPAPFSLRGPWVGVAAPGTDVVSVAPGPGGARLVDGLRTAEGTAPLAGTSYAAPYVSGLAALIRSRHPRASATEVVAQIVRTAHGGGHDAAVGSGVIDPVAAVATPPIPVADPVVATPRRFAPPTPVPNTDSGLSLVVGGVALSAACLAGLWLVKRRRPS